MQKFDLRCVAWLEWGKFTLFLAGVVLLTLLVISGSYYLLSLLPALVVTFIKVLLWAFMVVALLVNGLLFAAISYAMLLGYVADCRREAEANSGCFESGL